MLNKLLANQIQQHSKKGPSLQSCPTLCDPIDGSLPGSSVRGIFQTRVLEWVAMSFSTILIVLAIEIKLDKDNKRHSN